MNGHPDNIRPPLLGLAAVAAVCAVIVSALIHGVRGWVPNAGSIALDALLIWLVLIVVGMGGAWVLRRLLAEP